MYYLRLPKDIHKYKVLLLDATVASGKKDEKCLTNAIYGDDSDQWEMGFTHSIGHIYILFTLVCTEQACKLYNV